MLAKGYPSSRCTSGSRLRPGGRAIPLGVSGRLFRRNEFPFHSIRSVAFVFSAAGGAAGRTKQESDLKLSSATYVQRVLYSLLDLSVRGGFLVPSHRTRFITAASMFSNATAERKRLRDKYRSTVTVSRINGQEIGALI